MAWRSLMTSRRWTCWRWRAMKRPESGQSLLATTAAMEGVPRSLAEQGWLTSAPKKTHVRFWPMLANLAGWSCSYDRRWLRPPHFKLIFMSKFVREVRIPGVRPAQTDVAAKVSPIWAPRCTNLIIHELKVSLRIGGRCTFQHI